MEFLRMTEYESIAGHAHAVPVVDPDVAMMRLAAYENTGLSPEQIQEAVCICWSYALPDGKRRPRSCFSGWYMNDFPM